MKQEETKTAKPFKAFDVRTLRASNEVWKRFKRKKNLSGKSWDKFLEELTQK